MGRHGKKLFYGWFVVGALFMANFLGQGGVRNGFGIFVETWENEMKHSNWFYYFVERCILAEIGDSKNCTVNWRKS